ncbi:helix-turn-helix transcriptional regulator [Streptococcus oralis]|uniref:helix-turn-helix domain-containing protein n=2 Tax=Streptococcus TaxID=1301 RepID=UPI000AE5BA7B
MMTVSYKKQLHMMIEKEISNQDLLREANILANISTKIRTGKYIALDKLESICLVLNCTPILTMYLNL